MQCADCRGSGQYIGFFAIEDCRTCGGNGHIGLAAVATTQTPADVLAEYLREMASWRKLGNVTFVAKYINKILSHVLRYPSALPRGTSVHCVTACLQQESRRIWRDVARAPVGQRASLMQKGWNGKCCGLDVDALQP